MKTLAYFALLAAVSVPAASVAQGAVIRRDDVIQVVIDDTLSVRDNQPGDKFYAHPVDERFLPIDTKFVGRILAIRDRTRDHEGAMELAFTDVLMPDGSQQHIDAVPVPMSALTRTRDGRFVTKTDYRKRGNNVLGGAIGGFVIGSIVHNQLGGIILGTLAGIVANETDKGNNGDAVFVRGDRLGVLFNQDADISFDPNRRGGNPFRPNDGWRRENDPPDRNEPVQPTDPNDGGRNFPPPPPPTTDDQRPLPPVDSTPITVKYQDSEIQFERDQPYREGKTVMVPLEEVAKDLDLHVSDEPNAKSIFIDGDDGFIRLQIDGDTARVNGHDYIMDVPAVRHGDTVFVPIELVAQITTAPVFLNGKQINRHS